MRIFVTGGSGYIGRAVVAELHRRGHHVAALARSDKASATVRALGAQAVHGSLDSLDVIELAAREHDATIHLAAPVPPDGVAREAKLLDVLLRVAPDDHTIVYTSGAWVYGDRGDAVVDEDAPLAPIAMVAWRPAHEERVLGGAFARHSRRRHPPDGRLRRRRRCDRHDGRAGESRTAEDRRQRHESLVDRARRRAGRTLRRGGRTAGRKRHLQRDQRRAAYRTSKSRARHRVPPAATARSNISRSRTRMRPWVPSPKRWRSTCRSPATKRAASWAGARTARRCSKNSPTPSCRNRCAS